MAVATKEPEVRRSGRWSFSGGETARLAGMGGFILLLHVIGWGLFAYYLPRYPALSGLGALAYTFGLRHAFDADHIAAIDNTTRKFLQQGKRAMGTGFFFSLGHSTIVFALAIGIAVATRTVQSKIPTFQHYGGIIGASVSGIFLLLIGLLNLIVLMDILRVYREMKAGRYDADQLEETLMNRGFMSRFFGRFFRMINHSWQMYPLGVLFGLGFDTASEIALLAITAGVAGKAGVPFLAIMCLPILFAAGMCLMDTADGAFMTQAYGWAFSSPLRKIFYNISVTSLSVAIALLVGTVELVSVLAGQLNWTGPFFDFLDSLNFQTLGYIIVGMFVVTWAASVIIWKTRHIEDRWGRHLHDGGSTVSVRRD
ncbi:MAG TPA: HoxN/HupN/NixA family nickel/cobalt transporter [Actinomycetota bacterium]|jgi:high-affinity nickel-transport protein